MTIVMAEPTASDREMARAIAHKTAVCYRDTRPNDDDEHSPACNRLTNNIASALAAVRAETVEQCAALVAGWSTAVNSKAMIKIEENHCAGVAERDFAIAAAIRSLAEVEQAGKERR